jgi:hypothetical protein
MYYLFAEASTAIDPTKFTEDITLQQNKAAAALDLLWKNVIIDGGAFKGMAQAGAFVALFTLAFFMFYLMKSWTSNQYDTPISELVWPLIVALLLAGNGKFAGEMALSFRNVMNIQIQKVQISMTDTDAVKKKITAVATTQDGIQEITTLYEGCKTTNDPGSYQQCLRVLNALIEENRSKNPTAAFFKNLGDVVTADIAAIQAAVADPQEAFQKSLVNTGVSVMRAANMPGLILLKPIISGLAYLYQWLMELSMLATALLLPMALAVSLMPEHKAIFAWLTAMLSIANAKLCYIVITAWGAEAMLTDPSQDFIYLMFCGLGAPMFSLILASGGGLAMYSAFTDILSVAASAGVEAAGAGIQAVIPMFKK